MGDMEFDQLNTAIVSSEDLCKILPIKNKSYVTELAREHSFPRIGHNRYPLIEFIKRWIQYQEELLDKKLQKMKEETSTKSRLEKASAENKEFDLEIKRGTLIKVDEVKDAWLTEIQMIVNTLESFPIFTAGSLLGINDIKTMQQTLTSHVNRLRIKIAKQELKLSKNKRADDQLNSIPALDEDIIIEDDVPELGESDENKEFIP